MNLVRIFLNRITALLRQLKISSRASPPDSALAREHLEYLRLQQLIKRGDLVAIRNALESGISPNTENRFGWTLLMLAAIKGNVAIGELLIASGADSNKVTQMGVGQSALSLAVIGGHVRFLELLLKHGADPDAGDRPVEAWLPACRLSPKSESAILAAVKEYRSKTSN